MHYVFKNVREKRFGPFSVSDFSKRPLIVYVSRIFLPMVDHYKAKELASLVMVCDLPKCQESPLFISLASYTFQKSQRPLIGQPAVGSTHRVRLGFCALSSLADRNKQEAKSLALTGNQSKQ